MAGPVDAFLWASPVETASISARSNWNPRCPVLRCYRTPRSFVRRSIHTTSPRRLSLRRSSGLRLLCRKADEARRSAANAPFQSLDVRGRKRRTLSVGCSVESGLGQLDQEQVDDHHAEQNE